MGIFDKWRNNRLAKENNLSSDQILRYNEICKQERMSIDRFKLLLQAEEEGLSLEEYEEYLQNYITIGSLEDYKDYLLFREQQPGSTMSFGGYIEYISNYAQRFTKDEYLKYKLALENGLTDQQAEIYAKEYASCYGIKRYKDYLEAESLGITLERYDKIVEGKKYGLNAMQVEEWVNFYYQTYNMKTFAEYCKARDVGLTLAEYRERQEAAAKGLTLEDYRLSQRAKKYGIDLQTFKRNIGLIEKLEKNNHTCLVSDLSILPLINRLGVERIVIDSSIHTIPAHCFENCCSFEEILLPWGITTIGEYAFANCSNLKKMRIPGSIKNLPAHLFDRCVSLEEIEIHEGTETVNIEGWCDLPSLKSVASACTVKKFEIEKDNGFYHFSTAKDPQEEQKQQIKKLEVRYCGNEQCEREGLPRIAHSYSFENYPNLETIIIENWQVSSIQIEKCPRLKVIIVKGFDQSWNEYYKNGNVKKSHDVGESRLSLRMDNYDGLRFLLVPERLKDAIIYGASSMNKLSWLHIPSGCNSVGDLKAPNLTAIGTSIHTTLPLSISKVILCEPFPKSSETSEGVFLQAEAVEYKPLNGYQTQNKTVCGRVTNREKLYLHSKAKVSGELEVLEGTTEIPEGLLNGLDIRSVSFPYSLQEIQNGAFDGCKSLASVEFEKYPSKIGLNAFKNCENVEVCCKDPTAALPLQLMRMSELKVKTLDELRISEKAVYKNDYSGFNIRKVVIEKTVQKIGNTSFANCKELEEIVILGDPEIADDAFAHCTNICAIQWRPKIYKKIAGDTGFPKIKTIELCEEATSIKEQAFAGWGLESIIIPQKIHEIGAKAFWKNRSLKSICIKSPDIHIAEDAFQDCLKVSEISFAGEAQYHIGGKTGFTKMKKIHIGPATKIIEQEMFMGWGLQTVEIPSHITSVGSKAFANNKSLEKIVIQGDPEIAPDAFENCSNVKVLERKSGKITAIAGKTGFPQIKTYEIPEYVEEIGEKAFIGWGLEDVVIPDHVKKIGAEAFLDCEYLKHISYPDQTEIGDRAFADCKNLTTINKNKSGLLPVTEVERLPAETFAGCIGFSKMEFNNTSDLEKSLRILESCQIETVVIPSEIPYKLYSELLKIKSITAILSKGFEKTTDENKKLQSMPRCRNNIQKLYVPSCVNQITTSSLQNCENLTELILAPGVTVFDEKVFSSCKKLAKLTIHKNQQKWLDKKGLSSKVKIEEYGETDNDQLNAETLGLNAELPGKMTEIQRQKIIKITIPDGTLSIGEAAFKDMRNLREVIVKGQLVSIGDSAFSGCNKLKKINLPDSVEDIGERAFENCSELKEIHIPERLKRLKKKTFIGCSNMTAVTGMANVSYIDEDAFTDCTSLKRMIFSTNIFSIKNAFVRCSSLEEMVIPVDIAEFKVDLSTCTSLKTVYLPQNIDSLSCTLPATNHVNIIAYRGSSWRKSLLTDNVTYYKKEDMQELLEKALSEAGLENGNQPDKENDSNNTEVKTPATLQRSPRNATTKKTQNRAGWSTARRKQTDEIEFGSEAMDLDKLVQTLTEKDDKTAFTETEIEGKTGILFSKDMMEPDQDAEELTITSNIFSVILDCKKVNAPEFLVYLANERGSVFSSVKLIKMKSKTKTKEIKTQLQLNPGTDNGSYLVVCSSLSGDEILYTKQAKVNTLFAMDNVFSF